MPPASVAWRAVAERDAHYDGRFVYAVSSTGVFCRPSCASRRPRRDNVRFFPDAQSAEHAGYRACKRCRPTSNAPDRVRAAVTTAAAYLQAHAGERVTLAQLGTETGVSPHHLQRAFTQQIGISPRAYQDALRHHHFVNQLRAGATVSRATYEAGYGSSSRVYGRREVRAGMTPGSYRRQAAGIQVRFATVAVPLGRLLVAMTDEGVCAVELGDTDIELERVLRVNFSGAQISRVPATTNEWVTQIVAQTRGHAATADIPLDVQGTAFQWKVWKALQQIPVGQTRSYADVAKQIGKPKAVRAVAGACARNPVAIVVPCHRVVRTDGELGGYRWGVDRKKQLLDLERGKR